MAPDVHHEIAVELVGGTGEMGHHHAVLDLGCDSFLLDCGLLMPEPEDPGIDRVIPPLGAARSRWEQGRLRGLLLTHGHRDHTGAVGDLLALLPGLPVYGTAFTLAMVAGGIGKEVAGEAGELPGVAPAEMRTVRQGEPVRIGQATVTWLRVTHSIPSSSSIVVAGPLGTVVHSGDFRVQDRPLLGEPCDERGFREAGDLGVDLALLDSTGAGVPGSTTAEAEVSSAIAERIAGTRGRVVIVTFSTQVERLAGCLAAARATGRRVGVYGRSIGRVVAEAAACGLLPQGGAAILGIEEITQVPPEQALLVVPGSQGESRAPIARIARGEDPWVRLGPGDFVGWSARVIPGNERAVHRIVDRLVADGVDVHAPWDAGPALHCSGHGQQDEIARWLSWVRPRAVLPVHGGHWHLQRNRDLLGRLGIAQVLRARSGDRVVVDPSTKEAEVQPGRPGGPDLVVGNQRWAAEEPALRQRRSMARSGCATATVPWDGRRAGTPIVATLGVFAQVGRSGAEAEIAREVGSALRRREWTNGPELQEEARLALRRAVRRLSGTKVAAEVRLASSCDVVESV